MNENILFHFEIENKSKMSFDKIDFIRETVHIVMLIYLEYKN